jgi:hypothetical protein
MRGRTDGFRMIPCLFPLFEVDIIFPLINPGNRYGGNSGLPGDIDTVDHTLFSNTPFQNKLQGQNMKTF